MNDTVSFKIRAISGGPFRAAPASSVRISRITLSRGDQVITLDALTCASNVDNLKEIAKSIWRAANLRSWM